MAESFLQKPPVCPEEELLNWKDREMLPEWKLPRYTRLGCGSSSGAERLSRYTSPWALYLVRQKLKKSNSDAQIARP